MFEGLEKIEDIDKYIIDDIAIKFDMLDNFIPKDSQGELITINKNEGSLINDIMSPISIELAKNYYDLKWLLGVAFPQYSYGEYLTLWAENFGVIRKDGSKATGKCLFTGNPSSKIPKGFIVQTQNGFQFITTEEADFEDKNEILVSCEAIDIGKKYNVNAKLVAFFAYKPTFIKSVYNPEPFVGGTDLETDEELLERLLFKVRNPSASGNITDYIRWSKEVEGVYGVRVKPLWAGPGTVRVIVSGKEGEPLDSEIIEDVQNYLDPLGSGEGRGKAPIGAHVTVVTLKRFYMDITVIGMTIEKYFKFEGIKETIEANITDYFNNKLTDYLIRLNETRGIIAWSEGVRDLKDVLINNINSNITFEDEDYPTLRNVIYLDDYPMEFKEVSNE